MFGQAGAGCGESARIFRANGVSNALSEKIQDLAARQRSRGTRSLILLLDLSSEL